MHVFIVKKYVNYEQNVRFSIIIYGQIFLINYYTFETHCQQWVHKPIANSECTNPLPTVSAQTHCQQWVHKPIANSEYTNPLPTVSAQTHCQQWVHKPIANSECTNPLPTLEHAWFVQWVHKPIANSGTCMVCTVSAQYNSDCIVTQLPLNGALRDITGEPLRISVSQVDIRCAAKEKDLLK